MTIDRRSWGVWKFWLSAFVGALAITLAPILLFGRASAAASVGTVRVLIPTGVAADRTGLDEEERRAVKRRGGLRIRAHSL